MFYCPKCRTEVPAEALYCVKCGYNQAKARLMAVTPPSPQADMSPPTPKQMGGLIRPVGMIAPKQPGIPDTPSSSSIDFPAPPDTTPAHLLALSPITPSNLPRQYPSPSSEQLQGQQFMRRGFVSQPGLQPGVPQTREAQGQQNTHAEQQRRLQATTPSWPGSSAAIRSNPVVQHGVQQVNQAQQMLAPSTHAADIEVVKGRSQLSRTLDDFEGYDEGYVATSQAAEHWRTSWRKRQHSEAGPATAVSRGQSAVPEPLMAMQHSFARLRAIVTPRQQNHAQRSQRGFWITMVLMVCLMLGLIGYIAWTFVPTDATTQPVNTPITPPLGAHQPGLRMQGKQVASIKQGQMLHIHGDNFDVGAPIIFLLDGLTAINGTNGRELAVETTDQGSFDVAMPTATWSPGEHTIQAQDNKSEQTAYLNIEINLPTSATTSAGLGLSVATKLTFRAFSGKDDPPEQFVTLTNKNTSLPLHWYATAGVDNNLSWLEIDPTTSGGSIPVGGTGTIGISVSSRGLQSSAIPYKGNIIFTINQAEQLTLPVELQVQATAGELVVSPDPLIGILGASASCQAQTYLLLINIGQTQMNWSLHMDSATKQHIQFLSNGKPVTTGQLAAAGEAGDTLALTLACTQVHNNDIYNFTVSGNNITWPESVSILANP